MALPELRAVNAGSFENYLLTFENACSVFRTLYKQNRKKDAVYTRTYIYHQHRPHSLKEAETPLNPPKITFYWRVH